MLGVGLTLVFVAIGVGIVIALRGETGAELTGWFIAVVGVVVGVISYLMSSVQVRVDASTFVVAFGPFGRPRRTIALADVADVSAIIVEPAEWGGWGYRWIPWVKASAAVIRKGPGIALVLRDGRRFAVTVENAVEGAQATAAAVDALGP